MLAVELGKAVAAAAAAFSVVGNGTVGPTVGSVGRDRSKNAWTSQF